MTKKEAESILINGINQTDNSIAEYYKNIAKEKGYSLKVFFDELYNAFQRIEKYVNSYEATGDIFLDESGNEFKNKNTIVINNDTVIDSDNIGYLCRGLDEIAKELLSIEVINVLPKFQLNNQLTGFTCNLHPETVVEIYIYMADKGYLSGSLTDFQAIFSKVSIPVENPVKWQIFNERGIKTGRGNQTALFVFLEMMLGTVTNTDLKKCKDLFIDKKGKFIEKDLLRPDKDKISTFGFETHLKAIFKKADQLKNQ